MLSVFAAHATYSGACNSAFTTLTSLPSSRLRAYLSNQGMRPPHLSRLRPQFARRRSIRLRKPTQCPHPRHFKSSPSMRFTLRPLQGNPPRQSLAYAEEVTVPKSLLQIPSHMQRYRKRLGREGRLRKWRMQARACDWQTENPRPQTKSSGVKAWNDICRISAMSHLASELQVRSTRHHLQRLRALSGLSLPLTRLSLCFPQDPLQTAFESF